MSEPEWTATARTPLLVEERRHEVGVALRHAEAERARAPLFRNCSSAFSARRCVATAVVSASSSNRVLRHGMFV